MNFIDDYIYNNKYKIIKIIKYNNRIKNLNILFE